MIFLGTALLLPMGVVYAQAPQCTRVLLQQVSSSEIDQTVTGLAEMRINLDLAQARGNRSITDRKMMESFKTKMAEFSEKLGLQISKEELRALISKKVISLQGFKEKDLRQENLNRANEKESIHVYAFSKRIAFADSWTPVQGVYVGGLQQLDYVQKTDSLYFLSNGQILRWDLPTEKLELIEKGIRAYRSTENRLIITMGDGTLFSYDVVSKNRHVIPIKNSREKLYGDISLDGNRIAAIDKNRVEIYDSNNGKQLGFVFKDLYHSLFKHFTGTVVDSITSAKFISDSEILITSSSKRVFKFNFMTGEAKELQFGSRVLVEAFVHPESGKLILHFESDIASVAASDLANFENKAVIKAKWWISDIAFISKNLIVVRSDSYKREIMNIDTMEIVSDLSDKNSPGGVDSQVVGYDSENGRIFFGALESEHGRTTNIDVWSRQ
jgi:hypothetical protein